MMRYTWLLPWIVSVSRLLMLVQAEDTAEAGQDAASCKTLYLCEATGRFVERCSADRDKGCPSYPVGDFQAKKCIDRQPLTGKFLVFDVLGMIIWFMGSGFAMAVGVGGGGIYVPLGVLLLQFATKSATGLAQASTFGASLAGLLINVQSRHPKADRPIIDFDMALFLSPMEMAGARLGIVIQEILPDWAVISAMSLILTVTARKTFQKAKSTREKELTALQNVNNTNPGGMPTVLEKNVSGTEPVVGLKLDAARKPANNTIKESSDETRSTSSSSRNNSSLALKTDVVVGKSSYAMGSPVSSSQNGSSSSPGKTIALQEVTLDADDDEEDLDVTVNAATPLYDTNNSMQISLHDAGLPATDRRSSQGTTTGPRSNIHSREEWLRKDAEAPTKKYGYLILLWAVTVAITLFKGGKGMKSPIGVEQCVEGAGAGMGHWSYWIFIVLEFAWLLGFAVFRMYKVVSKTERKQMVNYPFLEEDMLWTYDTAIFYSYWTFIAGIIAGLIGIGGGMVLAPLMLQMGILPQVSTATVATMVIMTSSYAAVGYVTGNLVPWRYAAIFFSTAFVGAYFGKMKIDEYVKREKKTYILIYILAFIITFAVVFVALAGIVRYIDKGCIDGLELPCQ